MQQTNSFEATEKKKKEDSVKCRVLCGSAGELAIGNLLLYGAVDSLPSTSTTRYRTWMVIIFGFHTSICGKVGNPCPAIANQELA